jgi:(S)-2-hydroxyglutarate dehydrogenase
MNDGTYDVAVVGAGIVGLCLARELNVRHPDLRVVVIEKEAHTGAHQTSHNSGVIHGGIYYKPGSLKAQLCVEGGRLLEEFCSLHDVRHQRVGKLIVALTPDEIPRLDELERRGHANRTPGLRRLDGSAAIQEVEPNVEGLAALHAPNTGVVDYGQVARALETDLRLRGVDILLGQRVTGLTRRDGRTIIDFGGSQLAVGVAMVCGGAWSDRLAVSAGAARDPRIIPFRGAYLYLAEPYSDVVRGMIYPVPDPRLPFLGVHVTKHIDGRVSLGPTAMLVMSRTAYHPLRLNPRDALETLKWPGTWRMARRFWRTGMKELRLATSRRAFLHECARYVPNLRDAALENGTFSGIRAQAVSRRGELIDDFVFSETPGAWHVRNAPSPAATSSFAVARYLANQFDATRAEN